MINGLFHKGIFTINFHNGYNLDLNDRDCLTHCTVTTPNNFLDESDYVGGTFCLGTAVFDYTEVNLNFIFLGSNVVHCTGIPYNIPTFPSVLTGSKSYGTLVKNEIEIRDFLKKSVIAWAGFGATNKQHKRKSNK